MRWSIQARALWRAYSGLEWDTVGKYVELPQLPKREWMDAADALVTSASGAGFNALPGSHKHPALPFGSGELNLGAPGGLNRVDMWDLVEQRSAAWSVLQRGGKAPPPLVCYWPGSHAERPMRVFDADSIRSVAWGVKHLGLPQVWTRKGARWYFLANPGDNKRASLRFSDSTSNEGDLLGYNTIDVWPGSLGGVYSPFDLAAYHNHGIRRFPYRLFEEHYPGLAHADDVKAVHRIPETRPTEVGVMLTTDLVVFEKTLVPLTSMSAGKRFLRQGTASKSGTGRLQYDAERGQVIDWKTMETWLVHTPEEQLHAALATNRYGTMPVQREEDLITALQLEGIPTKAAAMDGRYLEDWALHGHGVMFVRAGFGTGKTFQAARLAQAVDSVTIITKSRALADVGARVFGVSNDRDAKKHEKETGELVDRVSTTLSTLGKLGVAAYGIQQDLLIFDEADSGIHFLFGGKVKDKLRMYDTIKRVMEQAGRCIVISADLDFQLICQFRSMLPGVPMEAVIAPKAHVGRKIVLQSHAQAKENIWDWCEQHKQGDPPLVVACSGRAMCHTLASEVALFGFRTHAITGHNSKRAEEQEFIQNISENVAKLDFFIFNTTIEGGVSIECLVDRVVVLHTVPSIRVEDYLQMVMRCRSVQHSDIYWGMADSAQDFIKFPVIDAALNLELNRMDILFAAGADPRKVHTFLGGFQKTVLVNHNKTQRDIHGRIIEVAASHGFVVDESERISNKYLVRIHEQAQWTLGEARRRLGKAQEELAWREAGNQDCTVLRAAVLRAEDAVVNGKDLVRRALDMKESYAFPLQAKLTKEFRSRRAARIMSASAMPDKDVLATYAGAVSAEQQAALERTRMERFVDLDGLDEAVRTELVIANLDDKVQRTAMEYAIASFSQEEYGSYRQWENLRTSTGDLHAKAKMWEYRDALRALLLTCPPRVERSSAEWKAWLESREPDVLDLNSKARLNAAMRKLGYKTLEIKKPGDGKHTMYIPGLAQQHCSRLQGHLRMVAAWRKDEVARFS